MQAQDQAAVPIQPERDSAPFWRSVGGSLLIQACDQCGEHFHYPRTLCPFCASTSLRWVECSGQGEIYSFSVVRRNDPYVIAFVQLKEGPRLLTNIVESDVETLQIGDPVIVVFQDIDGLATPMFRPCVHPQ